MLKPRVFRPFPYEEVGAALKNAKAVCVMDRADSYGGYGPLFMEIASALSILIVRDRCCSTRSTASAAGT